MRLFQPAITRFELAPRAIYALPFESVPEDERNGWDQLYDELANRPGWHFGIWAPQASYDAQMPAWVHDCGAAAWPRLATHRHLTLSQQFVLILPVRQEPDDLVIVFVPDAGGIDGALMDVLPTLLAGTLSPLDGRASRPPRRPRRPRRTRP